MSAGRALCLGLALLALTPRSGPAQGRSRCTLFLEGTTPASRSVSFSDPLAAEAYITHMSRGMIGRCGDATMTADSAIDHDRQGRLELFGRVHYRDTTRTLRSRLLTYFEREDRVLAEVDVVLTRLRSGSILRGPRVEFFRAPVRGVDRTVASGRPHITLRTLGGGEGGEPFEVDADFAEFIGEERARARGDVRIRRSDLDATADSAAFDLIGGTGMLYGSPVVKGKGFELLGDSVRVLFVAQELREVHALGDARAVGEAFELRSDQVKVRVFEGQVEELWAFGGPHALGLSEGYRLWGDSLHFVFVGGAVDSMVAVGRAAAVEGERGEEVPLAAGPRLDLAEGSNWIVGDTIFARFVPGSDGQPEGVDSAPDAGDRRRPLDRLRAVGNARSFYAAVRDSARADRPSRNYLVGREIEVRFVDGEASEVVGQDAVGVYLEPDEAFSIPPGQAAPRRAAPEQRAPTRAAPEQRAPTAEAPQESEPAPDASPAAGRPGAPGGAVPDTTSPPEGPRRPGSAP
ncbi:MAG: hypothetical protein ACE5JR_01575 [Gemmatimonadota bacterium]